MTQDGLESKRGRLDDLEKSEREARRLEDALGRGRASNIRPPPRRPTPGESEEEGQIVDAEEADGPQEAYLPPHPGPHPAKRKPSSPGMGLFTALSYTLHGMMDVDPETARRNGISKTRETISSVFILLYSSDPPVEHLWYYLKLEDALQLSVQDLKYSNSTIQADLDRFQRQKVADMREMAISMAKSHRDWCKKV
jgi:hypothetical protein